ncbi:hypothetical protein [Solwaraspora sp. WMMD792]|uniref:hypothetical protein n=1 Tax=Solwaraspora sp. WMMD792 TaxID=3016099 RepID=UPI002416B737|nr:hypothetical protein [Solwaraspora sp. WMMD792]MDG4773607.1 hypothetical protein [Solwaraspora sp. WMMD792]
MASRFFLVSYLTTYAASLFLLLLMWADHGRGVSFTRAWRTASQLTGVQVALVVLLVLVIAVLVTPFQLGLIRMLEGVWPRRLGGAWGLNRQLARKRKLEVAAIPTSTGPAELWRAGTTGLRLRMRYPLPDHLVRATRLGNILAAMEDRAGRDYGLDAVVAWPRLYPLLDTTTKAVVDDRRTTLDTMVRLAVTVFLTALASVVVLADDGRWLCLAAAPLAVSHIAYLGAIQAALAYSESVQAAFDLHHLAPAAAFGLSRPETSAAERTTNQQLCDLWRQSIPHPFNYATVELPGDMSAGGNT